MTNKIFPQQHPDFAMRRAIFLAGGAGLLTGGAVAAASPLTGLTVSGPSSVVAGQSAKYVAKATYANGTSKEVAATWSIAGTGASFSNGTLTTAQGWLNRSVTLTASYTEGVVKKTASWPVSITPVQVVVSSISGWDSGLGIVVNGRWTGQPAQCLKGSNGALNFLALESQSQVSFTIAGRNFGTTPGSIKFVDGAMKDLPGVTITVRKWTDTSIDILIQSPYTFRSVKGGYVRVAVDKNPPPASYAGSAEFPVPGFVGTIQTRGFGQCTWLVAYRRLAANLPIPPTAYKSGKAIDKDYAPQQYDALTYGTDHVAIISTLPVKVVERTATSTTTTWTFTLAEMNADCKEAEATSSRSFSVVQKTGGASSISGGIGTNANAKWTATTFFR